MKIRCTNPKGASYECLCYQFNAFNNKPKQENEMRLKLNLFIFITIIAFVIYCGKSDETYTVETIDGVKYVHNLAPAWGDEPKVSLELVRKIGEREEDENYYFYRPYSVVCDTEGNRYVLDSGNARIQKFDKDWNYLNTIGRLGEGPGEFGRSRYFDIDKESRIIVNDPMNFRLLIFSSNGNFIKTFRPEKSIMRFRILHSGEILSSDYSNYLNREGKYKDEIKDAKIFGVFDRNGKFLRGFGSVNDFGDFSTTIDCNSAQFSIGSDGNIYTAYARQNKIEKYLPDGAIVFSADRPLNYKVSERIFTMGEDSFRVFTYVSQKMAVDGKGRFWVVTYTQEAEKEKINPPADKIVFDIFDKNGVFLGQIPVPVVVSMYSQMRIFEDRMFLIVSSAEEMCVYEYKIVEK